MIPKSGKYQQCGLVLLPMLVFCLGCEAKQNTCEVTGTVSYMGRPLNTGIVAFTPEKGRPLDPVRIEQDGSYHIEAPPGNYRVAIVSMSAPENQAAGKMADELSGAARALIPQHYSNPATSGLVVKIRDGEPQKKDLLLR